MEAIYFFRDSASIRVPFYYYDRRLFDLLEDHGGVLDHKQRVFLLNHNIDVEKIHRAFSSFICVFVQKNSPIRIFGFDKDLSQIPMDSFCENQAVFPKNTNPLEKDSANTAKSDFSTLGPPPLPEKFPEHWRMILETELRARKYSLKTLRCYTYYNRLICRTLQKAPENIQPEDITKFLASVEKNRDYSASSINLAISAIKFFHGEILRRNDICEQHRPRHDKKLPMILSKTEISEMLHKERNPKHRLLLMLVYSSGLRVSEVVSLRKEHIDLGRKVIYVKNAKGRKDRCTLLSEKAANFIAEYYDFFNIETWLFPGQPSTHHLTIRSAQQIFDKAIRRANINKKISIHGLRHTFATHLLETGTDIRYIQSLLGHTNLRTTERYTHIARRNVLKIQSPLDTII